MRKLLLIMLLCCSIGAFAQEQRVSMSMHNVTVKEALKKLKTLTSYSLWCSSSEMELEKKISVEAQDKTINEMLDIILTGQQLQYEVKNKVIQIYKMAPVQAPAQESNIITGIVLFEEDNEPVVGASIKVKGTTMGTIADIDGRFTLKDIPQNAQTLIVSYVGMKDKEVAVKRGIPLKVTLASDVQTLNEVVVTGVQKMDKRLFTGATDQLSASNVKLDGVPDISRSLEGRSAGVSVQNVSGTFGTAPKIRVRGATSIYGSSKPLWVVDGVIMEDVVEVDADQLSSGDATTLISSAISGLNADDIESFQILKDGSATSIYGARAMSGVIVITTKKGKAGSSRVSYTGEYTMRLKPDYSQFNIMNSQDQMSVYQEMQKKGWLNFSELSDASESGVYGKMYELLHTYDPVTQQFGLLNTPLSRANYLRDAEMRNTDWFDLLFNTNVMHNHSVSISSGNDKTSYYASLSALVDPGWTKDSKVNRYTANLNATYNILTNLSLNLISSGSYRKQKAPGTLSQSTDPVSGEVKRDFDINPYSYALNSSRAISATEYYTRNYAPFNIFHELENNYMDINASDLKVQGELKWKILPNLEVTALGAMKYSSTSQEHIITDFSNQAMAYRAMPTSSIRDQNPHLYRDPDNPYALPISILPEGGIYECSDFRMLGYDFRGTISYNNVFKEKHIVNLFGGMESNYIDRQRKWIRGWGLQYSMGEVPFYAYQVFKKGAEEGTDYYSIAKGRVRNIAFFANATYSYKGIYTLNGTIRYEGSNTLGKTHSSRWLPTWNISGAWNIHEEEFFKDWEPALSHLSLKASYSLTADRGPESVTNSTAILSAYKPWRPTASTGEMGLQVVNLGNSDLTYEKKHELNIGVDVGLLDNRISVAVDWYQRNNYDLIGPVSTQGAGGEILKMGNIAEMKSNGVEFTLSTRNIQTKDFSWTTDFIYSHTHNEITKLKSNKTLMGLVSGYGFAREGYPVRSIFSIPFQGLNKDGIPTFLNQDGQITTTDINFQESKKLDFLKYSGAADPTDLGSFGNTFGYKGFKLNLFITYSFGNVVRLDNVFSSSYSDLTATPKEFKNRWMVPGDEKFTNIPVIASTRQNRLDPYLSRAYNAYNYSDMRIADGGFIRMKEIGLSYDFPKALIANWKLNSLSLKLQCTNLFLIYADKKLNGQDPEFFNSGGVATPVPRQFTLTLRLGM